MSILNAVATAQRQGNFDKALTLCRKAVAQSPSNPEAWRALAHLLAVNENWDVVVEALQKAVKLAPKSAEIYFELAQAAFRGKQLDLAESTYLKVLELAPGNLASLCNLGVVYSLQNRLTQAENSYRTALSLCPANLRSGIAYNLGEILRKQGQNDEALTVLADALAADPNLFEGNYAMGNVLFDLKRMDEAAIAYDKAISLSPTRSEPYFKLSQALLALGKLREAEAQLRHYLQLTPKDPVGYESLGRILILAQRQDQLGEVLESWARAIPGDHRLEHAKAAWAYTEAPSRASNDYVRQVFDNFAESFDTTLKKLDYRAPETLTQALKQHLGVVTGGLAILDAGCGTGLCGPLLRPLASRLVGVDLSGGMLRRAGELGVYDDLAEAELGHYLDNHSGEFDVIVSADTFVYFGQLESVLIAASAAMKANGILAFTLEHAVDDAPACGYRLEVHGRYTHTKNYVLHALSSAGLNNVSLVEESFRKEAGVSVPGLLVLSVKNSVAVEYI